MGTVSGSSRLSNCMQDCDTRHNHWPQQVTAIDHSRLLPMTTAGYCQWPQQVTANDHSRQFSHDSFISIRATCVSWRCHPLRSDEPIRFSDNCLSFSRPGMWSSNKTPTTAVAGTNAPAGRQRTSRPKIEKCRRIEHRMLRPVAYRWRLTDPPMIEFLETIS